MFYSQYYSILKPVIFILWFSPLPYTTLLDLFLTLNSATERNILKQVEKGKQDDALSDLSDLLGELKGMAIDMGSEIGRLVDWILRFL